MAYNKLKRIVMPNTTAYEIADWYGSCSTSGSTQTKAVSISGFQTDSLQAGVKVVVKFTNSQFYAGAPKLNVSNTGAKEIRIATGVMADKGEWEAGEVVTFTYDGTYWVIDNGGHASETKYGKTMLSTVYSTSNNLAATPQLVVDLMNRAGASWLWLGEEQSSITLVSDTTPSASNWTVSGNYKSCDIDYPNAGIADIFDNHLEDIKVIKITVGTEEFYFSSSPLADGLDIWYYDADSTGIVKGLSASNGSAGIEVDPGDEGAYTFKIELFVGDSAGIVTYPTLKKYIEDNGYLTLADLPIYNGSVT